jgi:hypothetical protein
MAFEVFRNDNDDDEVKDAARKDMPQVVGDNLGQLHEFEPNTTGGDIMPPLPNELSAEDLIAEYERKQAEKGNKAE